MNNLEKAVPLIDTTSPTWYLASTLSERAASLQKTPKMLSESEIDRKLAEQRFQRWLSEPAFAGDRQMFAKRLAEDGLSEIELQRLLGESKEAIASRFSNTPDWLRSLVRSFTDRNFTNLTSSSEAFKNEQAAVYNTTWFLNVIEPLILKGRSRVSQGIHELLDSRRNSLDLPFNPDTIENLLFASLPSRLTSMLSRTMILELHVARLQGLLTGESPEERFQKFQQWLGGHNVRLAILEEYPVLTRQLINCINQWVDASLELVHRLCKDWMLIKSSFNSRGEPEVLIGLKEGMGDRHRNGRSVCILEFSSGLRLVYKPRSLAVDMHFQQLLKWLNERGDHTPFRLLTIIDCVTYGWVEYVNVESCASKEQVERFYERQGGYLALLYALHATDFHFENLIASGEHPVLVDLETLFHPRSKKIRNTHANLLASDLMTNSVLGIGLLPQRAWANENQKEGVDISGLGALPGQVTPNLVPSWEGVGTDEMRFARKQAEIPAGQNRPSLGIGNINVIEYTENILTGFAKVYQLLANHASELLLDNSPLTNFANDHVRYVARPTRYYGLMLHESFHPDLLRNALDRDRFFDNLWVHVKHMPSLSRLIQSERKDLHNCDIPVFTTRPNSCNLWSSSNQCIHNFFEESGLALAKKRLRQLDESDLARQLWLIRGSITALALGEDGTQQPIRYKLRRPPAQTEVAYSRLLKAATAVGEQLASLAILGEQDITWIGLQMVNNRFWSLRTLGMDLYAGLPGIALFLGYLGAVTGNANYTSLAKKTVSTMQGQYRHMTSYLRPQPTSYQSIGAFGELGGGIYVLSHLSRLWERPKLLSEAQQLAELFKPLIESDEKFDVISGTAGCIGALLCLYHCEPSENILALATKCGNHLVAQAKTMPIGVGWLSEGAKNPLTGFSHGASGIAWSLLELSALSGEQRFHGVALEALAYERSTFSRTAYNWPDFRELESPNQKTTEGQEKDKGQEEDKKYMVAWCHGAPGIGLSRLAMLKHVDDPGIREDIDAAIETTYNLGFGSNHSLCHGDLGNLELFLKASQVFSDSKWQVWVDSTSSAILDSIEQKGWLCGVPLGVETPGLMNGIAGIGYQLLRLAEPKRVPSVLMLEPPTSLT